MSETPPAPRATVLRVAIDSPDPLVAASLAAFLAEPGAGKIELTTLSDPQASLLWDAGASRAGTRERLALLPAQRQALVLIADAGDAHAALAAGARGVLLRQLDRERLLAALHAMQHGLSVLDADIAARLLPAVAQLPEQGRGALTPRELEVLQWVADGLSNRRIGSRLGVSEHTIKFHVNAILEKLGADSRTQAVVIAVRRGLLWL